MMQFWTLVCDCPNQTGSHPLLMGHEEDCDNPEIFEAIRVFRTKELAEMEADEIEKAEGQRPQVAQFRLYRLFDDGTIRANV